MSTPPRGSLSTRSLSVPDATSASSRSRRSRAVEQLHLKSSAIPLRLRSLVPQSRRSRVSVRSSRHFTARRRSSATIAVGSRAASTAARGGH